MLKHFNELCFVQIRKQYENEQADLELIFTCYEI
jgi:hypothetical protein